MVKHGCCRSIIQVGLHSRLVGSYLHELACKQFSAKMVSLHSFLKYLTGIVSMKGCGLYSKTDGISFIPNELTRKTFFCLVYFQLYGDLGKLLRMGRVEKSSD